MAAMGGANPDDLLAQIRSLLDEYLALGSDTPVAGPAQQLAQAIDATQGGQGDAGADPTAPPDAEMPQDNTQLMQGEQGYSGTDVDQARQGALAMLQGRNKRTKAA